MKANHANGSADPRAYMIHRLGTADVDADPFPHYVLQQVFPDEYYQTLLRHLPGSAAYDNLYEVTTLKLDHFRHRDQKDVNAGWNDLLSGEAKTFWNGFNEWFLSPELARSVLQTFAAPMRARFGEAASWPEISVEVQLIRHRAGFFLQPHSDANSKLVVLLIYLPQDDSASDLGTSLYRPKDPAFACAQSKHYPFEDFVRVKTAPFRPNSMLAFFRSDQSFHGVEPLSENAMAACNRDLLQYVIYDRQARQAQLARRLAAIEEAAR